MSHRELVEAMLSTMHVVVVDDDAMVRDIVVEYLKTFGFKKVYSAKGGMAALKLVHDRNTRIDLILSDWEMPVVNGLTLLKAVRNAEHRTSCKFIMVTSEASRERVKIQNAGRWKVNAYLLKPFPGDVLKEKIWQVMGWNLETSRAESA